jgi:hypothetical protein
MKLVTGAIFLLASEQSYAHAQMVQFPNHESAASVLVPASVVFLVLGILMVIWGLLTDGRSSASV